jgi:hypothetical protein
MERTMNRRLGFCLGAFLCVAAAIFVSLWFATRPTHRIRESAIEEIKQGMTVAEVEAIFGVPAGDYSTRPVFPLYMISSLLSSAEEKTWTSNEASICVRFDDNQQVMSATAGYIIVLEESWWARLGRWLGLD